MKGYVAIAVSLVIGSGLAASQLSAGRFQSSRGCPTAVDIPRSQPLAADDFVELERTNCFGTCPAYKVRIRADGQVTWMGEDYVKVTGAQTAALPVEVARAIIEKFRTNAFWSLCDFYSVNTDAPKTLMTARLGTREKKVSHGSNADPTLLVLEREIETAADTHRWIHGDPQKELLSSGAVRSDGAGAKPGLTPLMQAAIVADNSRIRDLLAAKSDPNARDASGWTALVYATHGAKLGRVDAETYSSGIAAVKLLLDAGAKPDERSFMDQTPLMAAILAFYSPVEKAKLLIDAGANVNAQDKNGQTALMYVIRGALGRNGSFMYNQQIELCSMLRAAGARTDLRDSAGQTIFEVLDQELKAWTVPTRPAAEAQAMEAQYRKLRDALQKP